MKRDPFGVWEIVVPAKGGEPAIPHNTKVKVRTSYIPSATSSP